MKPRSTTRPGLTAGALFATAVAFGATPARTIAQTGSVQERLENTRTALSEWVENERILAAERAKWREGKGLLEARIELVKQRIAALREEIVSDRNQVASTGAKKDELADKAGELRTATQILAASIGDHEARIQQLVPQLPEPLLDTIRPLTQRLPKDAEAAEAATLSDRYFTVLAIMQSVNDFNREILVTSEVRELPGGASAEVTVLYVGLGQAYYASEKGDVVGVGHPTEKGWEWKPVHESAEQIVRAIAVYKNEQPAAFVPLPIQVK